MLLDGCSAAGPNGHRSPSAVAVGTGYPGARSRCWWWQAEARRGDTPPPQPNALGGRTCRARTSVIRSTIRSSIRNACRVNALIHGSAPVTGGPRRPPPRCAVNPCKRHPSIGSQQIPCPDGLSLQSVSKPDSLSHRTRYRNLAFCLDPQTSLSLCCRRRPETAV